MAFDPDPDIYFPGIVFDSAGVILDNSVLGDYDETDVRSLLYNIAQRAYSVYVNTTGTDQPLNMRIDKINFSDSAANDTYLHTFSFTFRVQYSGNPIVLPEPS